MTYFKKILGTVAVTMAVSTAGAAMAQSTDCACKLQSSEAGVLGELISVTGSVLVSGADGFASAVEGVELTEASRVLSGPSSSAVASFGGACSVELGASSRLSITSAEDGLCVQSTSVVADAGGTELQASTQTGIPEGIIIIGGQQVSTLVVVGLGVGAAAGIAAITASP